MYVNVQEGVCEEGRFCEKKLSSLNSILSLDKLISQRSIVAQVALSSEQLD